MAKKKQGVLVRPSAGRGGHYWPNAWTVLNRLAHVATSAPADVLYNAVCWAAGAVAVVTVLRWMGVLNSALVSIH